MATRGRGTLRRWISKRRNSSNGLGQRYGTVPTPGVDYCAISLGGDRRDLRRDLGGGVPRLEE